MERLSGVGKDKIRNLIKVVTFPLQGLAPGIVEVLIFHIPQCYIFTPAPWVTDMPLKDSFQDCKKEQPVGEKKNSRGGTGGTNVLVVNLLL